jgi:hypothetical protein
LKFNLRDEARILGLGSPNLALWIQNRQRQPKTEWKATSIIWKSTLVTRVSNFYKPLPKGPTKKLIATRLRNLENTK